MKILQLGKFYPIRGGVEKVMYDLTKGISERGIPCDMLCAILGDETTIALNDCGRIFCVKAFAKKAGTMLSPSMVRWLRKHCGEYDIIHVHHPDPMAALALRLSGYKGRVILHWHSDIVSQKEFYAFYKPLQGWLIRRSETIISTTPVYLRESEALKKVQDKCTAIPIGIAPLKAHAEKVAAIRGRFPGKQLVFSVGRLVPYKGMGYLVDAAALLPEDFSVVIGGTGPEFQKIRERVLECSLEQKVTLLGYVPDEELPEWFGACDVFVLPSTMKTEAFGIVQIEAMSLGKPVVATRIPGSGVSWVNQEGVSGVNVPPHDAQSLAMAISDVAERRRQLGIGAKRLFLERYQLSTMIDKTLQLYETCIKS